MATSVTTALAEVFGRRQRRDLAQPETFFIGSSELDNFSIATNVVTRELALLNIGHLLTKLGKTTDDIYNADYLITQDIVSFFSSLDSNPIDGIAYRSRHHDDGYCFALFGEDIDRAGLLKTKSIKTIGNFVSNVDIPTRWQGNDIDGEEMLTDILGYKIVPE